jgi:hypothetical protein
MIYYEEYPSEKYFNLKPTETDTLINLTKMAQIPDTMTAVVFDGPHNVSVQKRPTPRSDYHPPSGKPFLPKHHVADIA